MDERTPLQHSLGSRIRAARHIADFRKVENLAAAIRKRGLIHGLGTTKLRQLEREEVTAHYRDLLEIAEACGLPVAWFTADLSRLPEISRDPRTVIAEETAAALERSRERRANNDADSQPPAEAGQ